MRRPVGVIAAAIVLGLMTCCGLLGALVSFLGMLFVHHPATPGLPTPAKVIGVLFLLGILGMLVFSAWTVAGLFRMRSWARYSILVLGILTAGVFGILSAVMILLRNFTPHLKAPAAAPPPHYSAVMIAFGIFYAVIALIGVWWVVYFNLKSVRLAFASGGMLVEGAALPTGNEYGLWRGVVIALGYFMLWGGVVILAMAWFHAPMFLLGVVFRGNSALAVALALAALEIFTGIGLLRRVEAAYWAALAWQAFGILSMGLLLVPRYMARMLAAGDEFSRRFSIVPVNHQPTIISHQPFFILGGVGVCLFFIYALLRCRRWYLAAS